MNIMLVHCHMFLRNTYSATTRKSYRCANNHMYERVAENIPYSLAHVLGTFPFRKCWNKNIIQNETVVHNRLLKLAVIYKTHNVKKEIPRWVRSGLWTIGVD